MFDLKTIFGAGLVASVIAGWQQVKNFIFKIWSLIIRTDTFDFYGLMAYQHIIVDLYKNSKIFHFGNKTYLMNRVYLKSKKSYSNIVIQIFQTNFLFYKNKTILYFDVTSKKISYLRGTFNVQEFLKTCFKVYNHEIDVINFNSNNFYCSYRAGKGIKSTTRKSLKSDEPNDNTGKITSNNGSWSLREIFDDFVLKELKYIAVNYETLDVGESKIHEVERLSFTEEMTEVYNEVFTWYTHRAWFEERNIPHRRGILLKGEPGTGKSSTVREVCRRVGVPLIIFDLSTMDSEEFHKEFNDLPRPCVLLLEDIDSVFQGRKNIISSKYGLTFDVLLNHLSGAGDNSGIFVFITSNKDETLDPALFREGRIDKTFNFGKLEFDNRLFIAEKILKDWPDIIEDVVVNGEGDNGSQFENRCIKIAFKKFWNKNGNGILFDSSLTTREVI